ncbi:serine-rich adhesin for platelets-like [Dermacentor albipictus]|uniref:serine-rich adhesin for platelets-like n=1 Tax=Dermacentor albipictus TaxID=60249 RepID=UPI0038FCD4A3
MTETDSDRGALVKMDFKHALPAPHYWDIVPRKKKDSGADEGMDTFISDTEDDEDFSSTLETVLEESKDPSEEVLGDEASDDWAEGSMLAAILTCIVCMVPLIYFLFYVLYVGVHYETNTFPNEEGRPGGREQEIQVPTVDARSTTTMRPRHWSRMALTKIRGATITMRPRKVSTMASTKFPESITTMRPRQWSTMPSIKFPGSPTTMRPRKVSTTVSPKFPGSPTTMRPRQVSTTASPKIAGATITMRPRKVSAMTSTKFPVSTTTMPPRKVSTTASIKFPGSTTPMRPRKVSTTASPKTPGSSTTMRPRKVSTTASPKFPGSTTPMRPRKVSTTASPKTPGSTTPMRPRKVSTTASPKIPGSTTPMRPRNVSTTASPKIPGSTTPMRPRNVSTTASPKIPGVTTTMPPRKVSTTASPNFPGAITTMHPRKVSTTASPKFPGLSPTPVSSHSPSQTGAGTPGSEDKLITKSMSLASTAAAHTKSETTARHPTTAAARTTAVPRTKKTPSTTTRIASSLTSTFSSTTRTTYRPIDPSYVRRELRGLVCQTDAVAFLGAAIPPSCDFIMVDVSISSPRQHPTYSYTSIVEIIPARLEGQISQHVANAQDASLLLTFKRSVLHSGTLQPQAVARGLVQKVVDMKAHGIALSDQRITYTDARAISQDAEVLSNEIQSYHGIIRYDVFTGSRSALRSLMLDVVRRPSITFVYRVSGISRTFTHLYYDNFYSKKLNEENLSSIIGTDLARTFTAQLGNSLALSMTLMARKCPKNTVVNYVTKSTCTEIPLNVTHICTIYPGYLQGVQHSVMTRRYAGTRRLTDDVFFELENTFSAKVYLIMRQLQQAGVSPKAFILERYDLEPQNEIRFFDFRRGRYAKCEATPFGYSRRMKEALAKF